MSSAKNSGDEAAPLYGPPTQSGKIPFSPPGTDRKCETAYQLWGDLKSSNPPLIVLHGGPGAPGRDLQALAALQYRHGIPILLYDEIGCGDSTHLADLEGDTSFWTMDLFLAELDNIKSSLGIDTFDLLGHSCGGMIAVSYALKQPKGLRKLIIASSPASETLRIGMRKRQQAELPQEIQDTIERCEREDRCDDPEYGKAMEVFMGRVLCRIDPWPTEITEVMELMQKDMTVLNSLYGKPPALDGPWTKYDVTGQISQITDKTAPGGVLLTNGKFDMVQDEGMMPFFTQIPAKLKWVRFAESSHMPHIEEHEAYIAALGEFLTAA